MAHSEWYLTLCTLTTTKNLLTWKACVAFFYHQCLHFHFCTFRHLVHSTKLQHICDIYLKLAVLCNWVVLHGPGNQGFKVHFLADSADKESYKRQILRTNISHIQKPEVFSKMITTNQYPEISKGKNLYSCTHPVILNCTVLFNNNNHKVIQIHSRTLFYDKLYSNKNQSFQKLPCITGFFPSPPFTFFILFLSAISPSHPKARLLHCKYGAGPDTQGEIQDLPSWGNFIVNSMTICDVCWY